MFAARTNWPLDPNRLALLRAERKQRGLPILDLTESNPTRCGFEFPGPRILNALTDPRALTYEPDPRGLATARQAVAGYYREKGIQLDPEQVFLTTSTSEAYSYVFRLLTNPGESILVPRPSYPLFEFLGSLNDLEIIPYPLTYDGGWRIEAEPLQAALRRPSRAPRAVVVVHPNNPTGSFLTLAEVRPILAECAQHGVALIADEVFADYALEGNAGRVVSHASFAEILTFTLSGLSKISALPQMKLAWLVANGPPPRLREALARLEIIGDTYLSLSTPLACALPAWLEMRREVQPQILERLRSNLRWLDGELPPGSVVRRLKLEGGWYVILHLPAIQSDEDWAVELLAQDGVMVHPGHFYDFASEGHLVISLLPSPELFQEGISRLLARVAARV
jgi:hypothetical protein